MNYLRNLRHALNQRLVMERKYHFTTEREQEQQIGRVSAIELSLNYIGYLVRNEKTKDDLLTFINDETRSSIYDLMRAEEGYKNKKNHQQKKLIWYCDGMLEILQSIKDDIKK